MNKERKEIQPTDSIQDVLVLLSEGNPGAARVLVEIYKDGPDGFLALMDLDDMNIRGSQIWLGYKDFAGQDLGKFISAIKSRDPELVRTINENTMPGGWRAVTSGASHTRERL